MVLLKSSKSLLVTSPVLAPLSFMQCYALGTQIFFRVDVISTFKIPNNTDFKI